MAVTPLRTAPYDFASLLEGVRCDAVRDQHFLHLTANEAWMSETARSFLESRLCERYFMGGGDDEGIVDFGPFTFLGLPGVGAMIESASSAACELLGATAVNLSALSGIHAMMCALLSVTEPGESVMTVGVEQGGHFATENILERTGRRHVEAPYSMDELRFDVVRTAELCEDLRVAAIYLDASFYLNPHDLNALREEVRDETKIVYDASHTLGLVMGREFQDPLREGADVLCGNTHKTLPGPQKGLISFRDPDVAERANGIINSGLYSSSHTGSMLALAITILEMREFGRDYAAAVIENANALGSSLDQAGLELRVANTGRWTENHQIHLFTDRIGEYRDLYSRLRDNNISVNFDQPLGGRMFIRLGTQELTRRGMTPTEMDEVARLLAAALQGRDVSSGAVALAATFTDAHYSFDTEWMAARHPTAAAA